MKINLSLILSVVFAVICLFSTVSNAQMFMLTHSFGNFFFMALSGFLTYWNAKTAMAQMSRTQ